MKKKDIKVKEKKKEIKGNNGKKFSEWLKKNKKKIIIVASIIVALAIAIFLYWFFNRKFEVIFDYNNGMKESVVYVKYNKIVPEEDIKNEEELGKKFLGWYEVTLDENNKEVVSEEKYDFNTKIKEGTNLKALYDTSLVVITFDSNGGSSIDSITIAKGDLLKLPKNPTRNGYTFSNWKDKDGNKVVGGIEVNENITLYAVWNKLEESISVSLSRSALHKDGYTTSKATATTKNTKGTVTYFLDDTACAIIDSSTGNITLKTNISANRANAALYTKCYVTGLTVTVTATLTSGKKATAKLIIEPSLKLSVDGEVKSNGARINIVTKNDFQVTANQNVTWSPTVLSGYKYTGTLKKTATLFKGTQDCTNTSTNGTAYCEVNVKATTAANQTRNLNFYSQIN